MLQAWFKNLFSLYCWFRGWSWELNTLQLQKKNTRTDKTQANYGRTGKGTAKRYNRHDITGKNVANTENNREGVSMLNTAWTLVATCCFTFNYQSKPIRGKLEADFIITAKQRLQSMTLSLWMMACFVQMMHEWQTGVTGVANLCAALKHFFLDLQWVFNVRCVCVCVCSVRTELSTLSITA